MFERFTKEARAAVVAAQAVARETGTRSIDTRHLLVALLETPGPVPAALQATGTETGRIASETRAGLRSHGIDGAALAGIGIDLDAVRRQAEAVFGPGALEGAARVPKGHIPFTADGRKALELALREAMRLHHKTITSSHLALGILRADCPGRAVLVEAGIDGVAFRSALEQQRSAA